MPAEIVTVDPVPNSKRKVFFGLFVFPMLIAVTMALLLSGVVLITHEEETPESLIAAIKTGAPSKRWQKAFELSNELNRQVGDGMIPSPTLSASGGSGNASRRQVGDGMIRSAGIMNEIIHILNDPAHYDAKTRAYMAMALGRFRAPEAEAALRKALREIDDNEDPKLALFLMWTIGNFPPSPSPLPLEGGEGKGEGVMQTTAAQDVARFLESVHDDLRKTAAYVLGVLGDKEIIPNLQHAIEDSVVDVRWNAALSLARLGDDSGREVLLEMVDRNRLRQVYHLNEAEIERVMVNALKGFGLIEHAQNLSVLGQISKTDPSLKVRQAALDVLEQLSLRANEVSEAISEHSHSEAVGRRIYKHADPSASPQDDVSSQIASASHGTQPRPPEDGSVISVADNDGQGKL